MREGGFSSSAFGQCFGGNVGRECKRCRTVCGVTTGGSFSGFDVNVSRRFFDRSPRRGEREYLRCSGSGVKGSLTPPLRIPGGNVVEVESTAIQQALGDPYHHVDWATDAIAGR
jgi:hypothetical protein